MFVTLEQDADGNLVVPLPDEVLQTLGVGIGDRLYIVDTQPLTLTTTPPRREAHDDPGVPLIISPRTGPAVQDGAGSKDE